MIGRTLGRPENGSPPLDESQPGAPRPAPEPSEPPRDGDPEIPPELVAVDEPATEPAASTPPPAIEPPPPEAPGIRDQFGATRSAAKRLVDAHVELGKAEVADIGDAIKKVAVMAGVAVVAGLAAALLLLVGLPLFLGDWIFGSIGWGLLHGLLILAAVLVAALIAAVDVPVSRIAASLLLGAFVGAVAAVALGLDLTNRGWGLVGDAILPAAAPDVRPLAAALVVLPIVAAAVLGLGGLAAGLRGTGERAAWPAAIPTALYVGWLSAFLSSYSTGRTWFDPVLLGVGAGGFVIALVVLAVLGRWPAGGSLVVGLAGGTLLGLVVGVGTAIAFGPRVGAAVGVAVGLVTWIAGMGAALAASPPDFDALKDKFIPRKTIDMTKETIEWVRARMPLPRGS